MKKKSIKLSVLLTTLFVLNIGVVVVTYESGERGLDLTSLSVAHAGIDYLDPLPPDSGYQICYSGTWNFHGTLTMYCGSCGVSRITPHYDGYCRLWKN